MTVALSYLESGQGLPVVLLHAFPLSSTMWTQQRDGLGEKHRIITPDQRGFGASRLGGDPASMAKPSLSVAADDVVALLNKLELDQVVLGGLSMGGYVAMAVLRKHPERVRALILADTKAGPDSEEAAANRLRIAGLVEESHSSQPLLDEVVPGQLGETTKSSRPQIVEKVKIAVRQAAPASVVWAERAMAERPDSFDVLAATTVPTLVLVGEEDGLTPVSEAEAMVAALPDARLVTLPGVGHLSAVEDGVAFNAAVGSFLSELS